MPDPNVIAQGLQRLGFAPTPENVKRAQEMIASDPSIVDRMMGLQGGAGGESGSNASVMLSRLDKLAGDSSNVRVGPTTGAPLPQAPLPENMEPRSGNNGTSSPTSVATTPKTVAPTPAAITDVDTNNNVSQVQKESSRPLDTAVNRVADSTASAPPPVSPNLNTKLTYTLDPTGQVPDEFIMAGGGLAAGAALYAKMKADKGAIANLSPQMSAADLTVPAAGPRAASLGDIDNTAANEARIKAELDADPSRQNNPKLKKYGEPDQAGEAAKGRQALQDVLNKAKRIRR